MAISRVAFSSAGWRPGNGPLAALLAAALAAAGIGWAFLHDVSLHDVPLAGNAPVIAALPDTALPPSPAGWRPASVSETEWRVLNAVAARSADRERTLALLLDKLRYAKLQERWQQLATADSAATLAERRAIAGQLLADLPAQVSAGAVDVADARRWQEQWLATLENDPAKRRQRQAEESRRLQVLVAPAPH